MVTATLEDYSDLDTTKAATTIRAGSHPDTYTSAATNTSPTAIGRLIAEANPETQVRDELVKYFIPSAIPVQEISNRNLSARETEPTMTKSSTIGQVIEELDSKRQVREKLHIHTSPAKTQVTSAINDTNLPATETEPTLITGVLSQDHNSAAAENQAKDSLVSYLSPARIPVTPAHLDASLSPTTMLVIQDQLEAYSTMETETTTTSTKLGLLTSTDHDARQQRTNIPQPIGISNLPAARIQASDTSHAYSTYTKQRTGIGTPRQRKVPNITSTRRER